MTLPVNEYDGEAFKLIDDARKQGYRAGLAAALKALEEWRAYWYGHTSTPSAAMLDETVNRVKALLEEKP